jgi:Zn-dependent protease
MFGYNSVSEFVITGIVIIISLSFHEYAHAITSVAMGDDTPKRYGRLSLNPAAHIDIIGLICLFLFKFGWAKPVPINPYNYRNQKKGIILTSIAGPAANIILAFLTALIWQILKPQSEAVQYFMSMMLVINAGLAVFNLIPIPPLDGSKIFAELFGGAVAEFIYKIDRIGTLIIFALLWLDPVNQFLSSMIRMVITGILTIVSFL